MFWNNLLFLTFFNRYFLNSNLIFIFLLNILILHVNIGSTQNNWSFRWYCNPFWFEEFANTVDVRVYHVLIKQEISHPFRYDDINHSSYLIYIDIFSHFLNKLEFISKIL